DITQETAIVVSNILTDSRKIEKTRNLKNYIRGIIVKEFANHFRRLKKQKLTAEDIDWMTDSLDQSMDIILDNQVKTAAALIDDYLRRHPKSFTPQNKRLWEILKKPGHNMPEMIEAMGMKNRSQFDTAKNRLFKRIIAIYMKIKVTRLI
ncbi:MAG: hypothetical protein JST39_06100, partial [Bacteroidetes bacterium]|nr:hypothetical protein [Bacteroidota bacterium]